MRDLQGLLARIFDVAMIFIGAAVASQIRFNYVLEHRFYVAFVAFAAAFSLALFPGFGVYQSWRGRSKLALAGQVSLAWLIVQACALVLMFSLHRIDYVSRLWFAYWTAMSGSLLIAGRLVTHAILARMRNAGMNLHQVVVVGCGRHCESILRKIDDSPASGFRAAAAYNATPAAGQINTRVPVFEQHEAFVNYVRAQQVHEVWLALPLSQERTIHRIVTQFRDDFVNIRFIPDVRSISFFNQAVVDLLGVPAINLAASPITDIKVLPKLVFDRVFAACVLLGTSPLLIVIAVLVKLSSPGPVFFKQKRKGIDGREFEIYKFRSMKVHAETPGRVTQARKGDKRVTRVGAFLRRTSLDELPQFINVLKGEMSVVGPRPHALEHDDIYKDLVKGYMYRYRIKPGITGWAQVNGYRGETDRIEKMMGRVKLDLYYMQHWTFGLDMKIVALTLWKGFAGANAY